MKIENIRLFLAVVRTGSINKAAESLFISQQSLGIIIRSLERELALALLARSSKGVRLTRRRRPQGQQYQKPHALQETYEGAGLCL